MQYKVLKNLKYRGKSYLPNDEVNADDSVAESLAMDGVLEAIEVKTEVKLEVKKIKTKKKVISKK